MHGPVYRSRLRVMVEVIGPVLSDGDRVLDVGCGSGTLGRALMDAHPKVQIEGLERVPRGGEAIPVTGYDGGSIPFDDDAFEVVIVADVLHHEQDPDRLLAECARVAKRAVVVKDHQPQGPAWTLPYKRICLMDWAANAPYGVPCLYRYPTAAQWREQFARLGLGVAQEHTELSLYPWPYRWVFTSGLQYLAVLKPGGAAPARA